MTVFATAGLITATVYSLWMIHVTFFGLNKEGWKIPDFSLREMSTMFVMVISLVLLGLYPQPLLNTAEQSLNNLQKIVREQQTAVAKKEMQADLPSDNSSPGQTVPDGRRNP
jgi:NADH:ubiquinone oxidoreductase subunit 4 (subunit M)